MSQPTAQDLIAPEGDLRTFRRFHPKLTVSVRLADSRGRHLASSEMAWYQTVAVRDVSMTGIFFYSNLAYPVGETLDLRFPIAGITYTLQAIVRREPRVRNFLCGCGCDFIQSKMDREFRIALGALLLRCAQGETE